MEAHSPANRWSFGLVAAAIGKHAEAATAFEQAHELHRKFDTKTYFALGLIDHAHLTPPPETLLGPGSCSPRPTKSLATPTCRRLPHVATLLRQSCTETEAAGLPSLETLELL